MSDITRARCVTSYAVRLGVVDLVERFHRKTGELFAEDRALLVEPSRRRDAPGR